MQQVVQIIGAIFLAGAVYGGIRSDLQTLHADVARVEKSADKAHERIDTFFRGGK